MGFLAIGCFVVQGFLTGPTTTKLETSLFSTLQFLLTAGFSWFSSRAVSRADFETSLKRFAISAYRRIADVEHIIERLQRRIRTHSNLHNDTEMRVVEAIVLDCAQVVKSSISDWSDVIGEELLALEKIRRLQDERDALEPAQKVENSQDDKSVQAIEQLRNRIEEQIEQMQRALPPALRLEASSSVNLRSDSRAAKWMRREHERSGGLRMTVVTGDDYRHDRHRKTLQANEQLLAHQTGDAVIDVYDLSGKCLGRLQNPTPLDYDSFMRAFFMCFGDRPVSLKYIEDKGEDVRAGHLFAWFSIQVITSPVTLQEVKAPSIPD